MLNSRRLAPIQDLAEQREDAAARDLAEAQRMLAQRENQLRELENYREPELAAASIEILRNREAFRLRLAEAIRQQRRVVDAGREQVELQRQRWLGTHQQTGLYEKLAERARTHERQRQNQRDLRELDELALRMAARTVMPS